MVHKPVLSVVRLFVHVLMHLAGLRQQKIVIELGTVMTIWVPKQTINKTTKIYNPPDKPALLLVQAFALDGALNWMFQVLALSRSYSLYIPDILFFGGSYTDRPERTADFQAEFLAKGMKTLGVKKCAVVGLSYGGMVAFRMAKLYPELVKALVACDTCIECTESISRDVYEKFGVSSWAELMLPTSVEAAKRMLHAGINGLPPLPKFFYRGFVKVMCVNKKERIELLEALVIPDEDASDTNFSQPIHLLWGDSDKIFSLELARRMKEQLGEATTLQYIKRTGHLSPNQSPFAFNRRLKKILESLHKDDWS